jgi:hypothetical protein
MARKKFQGTLQVRRLEDPINSSHQPKPKWVAKVKLEINEKLSAKEHQFMNIGRRLCPPRRVIRSHS